MRRRRRMTHWKCFPDSGATNAGGSPVGRRNSLVARPFDRASRLRRAPISLMPARGSPASATHWPASTGTAIAPSDDEAEPSPPNRSPARLRTTASCRLAEAPVLRQGAESRKGGLRLGRSSRHDRDYGMDERYATPLQPTCSIVDDVSDQGRTRRLRSCGVWPCSIISADNPVLPTRGVNPRTQIGDDE